MSRLDDCVCRFCGKDMGDDPTDPGCCSETWGRCAISRAELDAEEQVSEFGPERHAQIARLVEEAMSRPAPTVYPCCGREYDEEVPYCTTCEE